MVILFKLMQQAFWDIMVLHNNKWIKTKCSPIEQKYPYRSWPTHEELVLFSKQNKYIKLTDLF